MTALICECGSSTTAPNYPKTGLVLLSLRDGSVRAKASIGADPVAVTVSADGSTAYVADSAPGDVYAVSVPQLQVMWRTHTGGAPFGMILYEGLLFVTLYDRASIALLEPITGRLVATNPAPAHPAAIAVDAAGRVVVAAGSAFGITLVGSVVWTADYRRSVLSPAAGGKEVPLPLPLHPFWLAPGSAGNLLIAAEGESEDSDSGAVFSYDVVKGSFSTLARPRDPDQVVESGNAVFVAAHGERDVLRLTGSTSQRWASGAAAVAIAPDASQKLLVVAVNAHE